MGCRQTVQAGREEIELEWDRFIRRALLRASGIHDPSEFVADRKVRADSPAVIVFHWEDTLCPTTWLENLEQRRRTITSERHENAIPGQQESEVLSPLSLKIVNLLAQAGTFGKVVVVSSGSHHEAMMSLSVFMPQIEAFISANQIPVISASEQMNSIEKAHFSDVDWWRESRIRAFHKAVASASPPSKKDRPNILFIGDSSFQDDVLSKIVREDPQRSHHIMSFSGVEEPSPSTIFFQVSALAKWLPDILRAERDVHIELPAIAIKIN